MSSKIIGFKAGVPGAQVRKDLLGFKAKGRPSMGFHVPTLRSVLEDYLGLSESRKAVLVGAGNLGKALSRFPGFKNYHIEIELLLDNDPKKIGQSVGPLEISNFADLDKLVRTSDVRIGIIATPAASAQKVAEQLVEAGVIAIWNFSPVRLKLPPEVFVKDEDLSAGIAILSHKAAEFDRSH